MYPSTRDSAQCATSTTAALEGRMSLTYLLLFVHIALMIAATTVGYGGTLLLRVAYLSGQIGPLRGVGYAVAKTARFVPILYISGGVFGLLTAIAFGFPLIAPWLVIAYVLFALAMLLGIGPSRIWGERAGKAISTAPDGSISPEVRELFDAQSTIALLVVDVALVVLLVFDMVIKPFS
jgi:hypothetical protein